MFVSFCGADNFLKLRKGKGVKRDAPPSHSFAPSPWRKCYKKDGDNINGKRDYCDANLVRMIILAMPKP